jgi:hypothetical protein
VCCIQTWCVAAALSKRSLGDSQAALESVVETASEKSASVAYSTTKAVTRDCLS